MKREAPASALAVIALAVGLSLGPAVGQGLGRFAYALLLPAMRQDLGWSYTLAGGMNTANAVGYLLGTLDPGLALSTALLLLGSLVSLAQQAGGAATPGTDAD